MKVRRGDVVLLPIVFTSGGGAKLRQPSWSSRITTTFA